MKGYKIFVVGEYGFERYEQISTNYDKAVQIWNDTIRKTIKEKNCIYEDFGEEVQEWKEDNAKPFFEEDKDRYEFLYGVAPIIVYKDKKENSQIAEVYYSYKCSYEYDEWDTRADNVVLKEIEIIE